MSTGFAVGSAGLLQGGWPLLLARVLFVSGLLSAGGTMVFQTLVMTRIGDRFGPGEQARVTRALGIWCWWSLGSAWLGLGGWSVLQTVELAGTWRAIGTVLTATTFGHVVLVQGGLLAATSLLLAAGRSAAVLPAMACVGCEAGHGHGMAIGGVSGSLFQIELIHVMAAAVWIGGLVPLLIVVRLASARAGAAAARWFSPVGKWAVGILVLAAVLQAAWLAGGISGLTGTAYGWMLLVKGGAFVTLFGFALLNRYRLAPGLAGSDPAGARRSLMASIGGQSALGLLTVVAASVLSALPPGGMR